MAEPSQSGPENFTPAVFSFCECLLLSTSFRLEFNPGPAEPGYALSLQTA